MGRLRGNSKLDSIKDFSGGFLRMIPPLAIISKERTKIFLWFGHVDSFTKKGFNNKIDIVFIFGNIYMIKIWLMK